MSDLDFFVSDSIESGVGEVSWFAWAGPPVALSWLPTLATIPAWRTSGRLWRSMSGQAMSSGAKGMRSPIYWALLGLVIERPSYGYELIARFERVYGDVLPISGDSQVYNALTALEDRSLIGGALLVSGVSSGTDRQPKRHYRATDLGREGYQAQLVEQMREARRHSQRLARQLAVFARKPQMALEIIDGIEEVCLEEAIRAPIPSPSLRSVGGPGSALVDRLAAEESRLAMEATLPWIEFARATFRALADEEACRDEPAGA